MEPKKHPEPRHIRAAREIFSRAPEECLAELSRVAAKTAEFVTPLGQTHILTRRQLAQRTRRLQAAFLLLTTTPAERLPAGLSPVLPWPLVIALDRERQVMNLALHEWRRTRSKQRLAHSRIIIGD